MQTYDDFSRKYCALLEKFRTALEEFIHTRDYHRAYSWEGELTSFLMSWRLRGIILPEKSKRDLRKLMGELRQRLVPEEQLRALREDSITLATLQRNWRGPIELGEPKSPEEAANTEGLRQLGHGIMQRHPPERWMFVVDDVLASWRFTDEGRRTFRAWMAVEAQARLAEASDSPADPVAAGSTPTPGEGTPGVLLAVAEDKPADGTGGNDASSQDRPAGEPPFNEEAMRALLRFMDPHVYRWWLRWGKLIRVNTTRGAAMFKSNADEFKLEYVIVKGKPQIQAYIYRASDAKSEFDVARAIIEEFYKHDSGGWASPAASNPGPKFTADEARWYQEWQQESLKVGKAEAGFIEDLYLKGVLSFNAVADAVVSVSDFFEHGFSFSTLAGVLPFIPGMAFRRAGKAAVLLKFGGHELSVGGALLNKLSSLSREYQKAILAEVTKAASKADAEKRLTYLVDGVSSGAIKLHHISTDKNWISTLRGGPWSPRFEGLFKKAGMTLDDAANKVLIPGHFGPHPEENHKAIYKRLVDAAQGRTGEKYKEAILKELEAIAAEATTAGTKLNKLLTE